MVTSNLETGGEPSQNQASLDRARILVVDDNRTIGLMLTRALRRDAGREVQAVHSADQAREALESAEWDLVITDIQMPGQDGLSLMEWGRDAYPHMEWIVLTGHGSFDAAVRALKLGAFDFITKPVERLAVLRQTVRNALAQKRLRAERDQLNKELAERNSRLSAHVEQLEQALDLLSAQSEAIRADLHRAALIQRTLLPRQVPALRQGHIQAAWRPSEHVGGDLYDIIRLDAHHVVLLIADAAGHGLSAAMLAVMFRHQLVLENPETGEPVPPADSLAAVNRALSEGLGAPGLFVTAALVVIDERTMEACVASAGHAPVVLRRASGELAEIHHTGPALGLYPEASFGEHRVQIAPGDRLMLHTDGLYEIDTETPEESWPRLVQMLDDHGSEPGEALLPRLLGGALVDTPSWPDDVTVMLYVVESGDSRLDHGPARPPPPAPRSGPQGSARILMGKTDGLTTFSLQGRGDWRQSCVFHDHCTIEVDAGSSVLLEMSLCPWLDSTFLGTLHELVLRSERQGGGFALKGVTPPVRRLFDELGMTGVITHIESGPAVLPGEMALLDQGAALDARTRGERVLKAHELLATLSERNQREFDPLVEMLRRELRK